MSAAVENPYGLEALWTQGDFVARGTLVIMVVMSMGCWLIMITRAIDHLKLSMQNKAMNKDFWKAPSIPEAIEGLKKTSVYRYIALSIRASLAQHEAGMGERIDFNSWLDMSVNKATDRVQNRLQDGLSFLATVGSTGPFIGLFGTVWGIYHALTAIGIAGQASIDKVAGPVGESLIMTAIGLAVAIPAVLGFNWLVRRNKRVMENVRDYAAELQTRILRGEKI